MVHREYIEIRSRAIEEVIDITANVDHVVSQSGVVEGSVLVMTRHTSCGVIITDSDRALLDDLLDLIRDLIPRRNDYRHDLTDSKRNAAAHLAGILLGNQVTVPIFRGELDLGHFQTIYYVELDGRRDKDLLIQVQGTPAASLVPGGKGETAQE
ncbi:MAG: secondary thiamine-phosphate synthase enzyme YjbQ [Planctomycetota bacterium]